ncbi:hypothetical protein [Streptomyces sp. NPDC059893]|uniref:hypothetical protein n=1 Tax=Streptomyces sp. NPDC059893 TaxID=3346990 RepID=UPI00364DFC5F
MPIRLPAPTPRPGGPNDQGMNRIALNPAALGVDDQCALRPRSFATLWESQDTRRARWGGFGPCVQDGDCPTCPIFRAEPQHLDAFASRILVRIAADGRPHLMNRAEDGWASLSIRWTWQELARLDGWTLGRRHHDEHSEGFWLEHAVPDG